MGADRGSMAVPIVRLRHCAAIQARAPRVRTGMALRHAHSCRITTAALAAVLLVAGCTAGNERSGAAAVIEVRPASPTPVPSRASEPASASPSSSRALSAVAGHVSASVATALALTGRLVAAREEPRVRARLVDDLHEYVAAEKSWSQTVRPATVCEQSLLGRFRAALGTTEHALGLFHHVGPDRSYEVLGIAAAELEAVAPDQDCPS